ncbi:hypothetical protein [Pectobacterium parmentieri]|uniref:hypothetical protein n=1 Tax=Pectobacterium parmentieri TaxID=1905730 RepID=UPI0018E164C8|nr:hypothetical protein [Pectobacterium parmentieri]QQA75039.1 hypothetical protein JBL47_16990 [Pectobacterium parmentieri]
MKYSYRVTKYKNSDGSDDVHSAPGEWTSFFDVGDKVDINDYTEVENQYVDFVIKACSFFSVNECKLKDVEINSDVDYLNDQRVKAGLISEVVRNILREKAWCKLVSDSLEFHFGYDFYMYFLSREDPMRFFNELKSPLTVKKYVSPYL